MAQLAESATAAAAAAAASGLGAALTAVNRNRYDDLVARDGTGIVPFRQEAGAGGGSFLPCNANACEGCNVYVQCGINANPTQAGDAAQSGASPVFCRALPLAPLPRVDAGESAAAAPNATTAQRADASSRLIASLFGSGAAAATECSPMAYGPRDAPCAVPSRVAFVSLDMARDSYSYTPDEPKDQFFAALPSSTNLEAALADFDAAGQWLNSNGPPTAAGSWSGGSAAETQAYCLRYVPPSLAEEFQVEERIANGESITQVAASVSSAPAHTFDTEQDMISFAQALLVINERPTCWVPSKQQMGAHDKDGQAAAADAPASIGSMSDYDYEMELASESSNNKINDGAGILALFNQLREEYTPWFCNDVLQANATLANRTGYDVTKPSLDLLGYTRNLYQKMYRQPSFRESPAALAASNEALFADYDFFFDYDATPDEIPLPPAANAGSNGDPAGSARFGVVPYSSGVYGGASPQAEDGGYYLDVPYAPYVFDYDYSADGVLAKHISNEDLPAVLGATLVTQRSRTDSAAYLPALEALRSRLALHNYIIDSDQIDLLDPDPVTGERPAPQNILGRGSYGTVFLAKYCRRMVAVKRLRTMGEGSLPEAAARAFSREVSVLSSMHHPNTVLFIGACMDPPSIVMEFVSGCSLHDLLKGPVACPSAAGHPAQAWVGQSEKMIRHVLQPISSGMLYIHQGKVTHGDLSSGNVLVDLTGRVKITDFGLSRTRDRTAQATATVTAAHGTPQYASPEAVRGELTQEEAYASDVFSFGMLCWESLVGKSPWQGLSGLLVLGQILTKGAQAVIEHHPMDASIPPRMRKLILGSWREIPAERPTFVVVYEEILRMEDDDDGELEGEEEEMEEEEGDAAAPACTEETEANVMVFIQEGGGGGQASEGRKSTSVDVEKGHGREEEDNENEMTRGATT